MHAAEPVLGNSYKNSPYPRVDLSKMHPQLTHRYWRFYDEDIREHRPRIVLTTSWVRLLQRSRLEKLFLVCGLGAVVECLHEECEAPQKSGESRLRAIERWLEQHHRGERYVVLDDHLSGTELEGSHIDRAGRLVLCDVGVGLKPSHLDRINRALLG